MLCTASRAIRSSERMRRSRSARSIRRQLEVRRRAGAPSRGAGRRRRSARRTARPRAHVLDGWNRPAGVMYCGWKLAVPVGTQSFQLSRRTRSAAEIFGVGQPDVDAAGQPRRRQLAGQARTTGSAAASTGASATSRTPSASCVRRSAEQRRFEQHFVGRRLPAPRAARSAGCRRRPAAARWRRTGAPARSRARAC